MTFFRRAFCSPPRSPGAAGGGVLLLLAATGCSSTPGTTLLDAGTGHGADGASSPPARDGGVADTTSADTAAAPDTSPGKEAGGGSDGGSDAAKPRANVVAYASGYAPDIHWFSVDEATGALTMTGSLASFGTSPSFLAVNPSVTNLYAVDENTPGKVGAYSIDADGGGLAFLGAVSSGGDGPPFVSLDATGKWVLVANYGDGSVSVLPVGAKGALGAAVQTLSVGMEAHMILTDPTNHFAFVPCKGSDYVAQYSFDVTTGQLTPNAVPKLTTATGSGPRHLAFHPNGKYAYLISETASTMSLLAFDSTKGTLTEVQTVSTIPTTFTGTNTAAEVHVHPSGAWLFGSNRGDDSIVVFSLDAGTGKMTLVGFTPSGGTMPRDFTLDATGTYLYAANQGTGNVVPFQFDAKKGTLTAVATPETITAASFVGLVALP